MIFYHVKERYGSGELAYMLFQKGFRVYFLNVAYKKRVYRRYTGEEKGVKFTGGYSFIMIHNGHRNG